MKQSEEKKGVLFLVDMICIALTTFGIAVLMSKMQGSFDMNLIIVCAFFYGIKLLIMGITDITGIGTGILTGMLFIVMANGFSVLLNYFMSLGVSYKMMGIVAAVEVIIILVIRLIRKKTMGFEKKTDPEAEDWLKEKQTDDELSNIYDEMSETGKLPRMDQYYMLENQKGTDSTENTADPEISFKEDLNAVNEAQSKKEDHQICIGDIEENAWEEVLFGENGYNESENEQKSNVMPDVPEIGEEKYDTLFEDGVNDLEKTDKDQSEYDGNLMWEESEKATETPVDDIPDNEENETLQRPVDAIEHLTRLTQEVSDRFDAIKEREQKLEQREEALQRKENDLIQARGFTVRPEEIVLESDESDIIINEADLELLKAYLDQHPEV